MNFKPALILCCDTMDLCSRTELLVILCSDDIFQEYKEGAILTPEVPYDEVWPLYLQLGFFFHIPLQNTSSGLSWPLVLGWP